MAGIMKFLPVSSKDQLADVYTNPLLPQLLNTLLSKLGILNIYHSPIYHSPTYGGLLEIEEKDAKEITPIQSSLSSLLEMQVS